MSVRWGFLLFAVALAICHVESLYSHKCKEAETASDKIGRFIENANCTLIEGNRKLRLGLQNIHNKFMLGIDHFKSKFAVNKTGTNQDLVSSTTDRYEGLDNNIDVRILPDDEEDAQLTTRPKRDTSDESDDQGKLDF
jgi:hypothetical protein